MSKFTITTEHQGQRLDKFLTEKLSNLSRSQIQKTIKSGQVLVNDQKPSPHHFLKTGDIIIINQQVSALASQQVDDLSMAKLHTNSPARQLASSPITIIADTPDYLILNKPPGLVVHQAPGHDEPTLVDLILEKYPAIEKIGEDPMRPGIVHRLDKEVSGLMVIAKTQDIFDHLKSQFKTRKVKKEYLALVHGTPAKPQGEIDFNIDRSVKGHKMAAVPESPQNRGKKALTEFEVLEKIGNYTLLKVKPYTGRSHQIRVHLNAYGLPVVGDPIYKPKKLKTKITLDRIFLQANYLGFYDLKDDWQEFNLPLDNKLQTVLDKLKGV